ncbi:MAG: hypothetical protein M1820_010104 [Bogoriella megaspora]|nr:MAG: hypothetical protein M1820_010104 [Bogoriella megaspora]
MSMITATTWVQRGFAARYPIKYDFDEAEFNRISASARLQLDDAKEDLAGAQLQGNSDGSRPNEGGVALPLASKATTNTADYGDLEEYDLDHYDDDDDQGFAGEPLNIMGNVQSLAYHQSNEEDPYITLRENEEEDADREELEILPTDNLILAGRLEDEVAHLEIYVYEDEADNLYVHHDIMLPAIPLAVEWISLPDDSRGSEKLRTGKNPGMNIAAVGMMEPDIELWDIDTVDGMYPQAILGPSEFNKSRKKKKKIRKNSISNDYHVDAVITLATNRQHRNLLLSGSADATIKLWDLNKQVCAHSFNDIHGHKVSSVGWTRSTAADSVFISGGYDKFAVVSDARNPKKAAKWKFGHDIEKVMWDPIELNNFYVNTDDGTVHCFDWRTFKDNPTESQPLWELKAHDSSISSFDVNPIIPGFLVTGSDDKTVKLWNVTDNKPSMVVSRDLDVGKVFSAQFAPDTEIGFRLAVAGSKGSVKIWDTSTNATVRRIFGNKIAPNGVEEPVREKTVGIQESGDESEEEEEGENDAMEE